MTPPLIPSLQPVEQSLRPERVRLGRESSTKRDHPYPSHFIINGPPRRTSVGAKAIPSGTLGDDSKEAGHYDIGTAEAEH